MRTAFEDVVLPHLDVAYRLALWVLADGRDAEDAVDESARRARLIHRLAGRDGRAWFLGIVHRTCSAWPGRARVAGEPAARRQESSADALRRAIAGLPPDLRAVLVLRDLEDLSYEDVADVVGIPVGTAVSRLSHARRQLYGALRDRGEAERLLQEECCAVAK